MAKATKKSTAVDEEQVDQTAAQPDTADNLKEPTDELEVEEGTEAVGASPTDVSVRVGEEAREIPVEEKLEVHTSSSDPSERQVVVADRRRTRNDNTGEEVVVKRTDAPGGITKPVRIVNVRSHPEIDSKDIGTKSKVEDGTFVGQQLSLEQVNRFSQRQAAEAAKEGDRPVTMNDIAHVMRRRGRSLR